MNNKVKCPECGHGYRPVFSHGFDNHGNVTANKFEGFECVKCRRKLIC